METLTKYNKKFSFKEFNQEWADSGNYSYVINFKNKEMAFEIEGYLKGFKFKSNSYMPYVNWHHKLRKNFSLRINPKLNTYHRSNKARNNSNVIYRNVYTQDYFKYFCFKFVIVEKTILMQ
jgi:hypothetical protein